MIARTEDEFRRTLSTLSDEYDRHQARILRMERGASPPMPKELEQYCTWLLRRQQCNEHLKRFYLSIQWLSHSHRDVLLSDLQRLLSQQAEVATEEEKRSQVEEGGVLWMKSTTTSLERSAVPLLSEYYRGGAGRLLPRASTWSEETPSVEDDYNTESSFSAEFQEQSRTWNFLPYVMDVVRGEGGDSSSNNNSSKNEGEEEGRAPATYIKRSMWTPFVDEMEDDLHHVGFNSSRSETVTMNMEEASLASVGGATRPPAVPSVRFGQVRYYSCVLLLCTSCSLFLFSSCVLCLVSVVPIINKICRFSLSLSVFLSPLPVRSFFIYVQESITRRSYDQILLTELEAIKDNDCRTAVERLRRQAETHHARCTDTKKNSNNNKRGERGEAEKSRRRIETLHDRSDRVFERNIGDEVLRKNRAEKDNSDEDSDEDKNEDDPREESSESNGASGGAPDGMFRQILLRVTYRQRHLKLRGMRRRLLSLLNYCRSTQRKLTMQHFRRSAETKVSDDDDDGVRVSHPSLNLRHELHRMPHDVSKGGDIGGGGEEGREDEYTTETFSSTFGADVVQVVDATGKRVMYDASLSDMDVMERLLLSVGTRILRQEDETNGGRERRKEDGGGGVPGVMDRVELLIDLYDSELRLKDVVRRYVDTLMSMYDNMVHSSERNILASEILDVMRKRPWHETEEGAASSCGGGRGGGGGQMDYRVHYDLLIATLEMKNKLLSSMAELQVRSERRTRSSGGSVDFNDSSGGGSRGALASIFEITLTMTNVVRVLPLLDVVVQSIQENVSTTHLSFSSSSSSSDQPRCTSEHVELVTLRLLSDQFTKHQERTRKEEDLRVCKVTAQRTSEELQLLASSKLSSWSTDVSDLLVLLRKHDDVDASAAARRRNGGDDDKGEESLFGASQQEVAMRALDSLVRNPKDTVGIEIRASRRVALIEFLILREESAFAWWETTLVEKVYSKQVKMFGSEVVSMLLLCFIHFFQHFSVLRLLW